MQAQGEPVKSTHDRESTKEGPTVVEQAVTAGFELTDFRDRKFQKKRVVHDFPERLET